MADVAETYPPLRAGEFMRTLLVRQPFATKSLVVLTVLANYASLIDEAGVYVELCIWRRERS